MQERGFHLDDLLHNIAVIVAHVRGVHFNVAIAGDGRHLKLKLA